MNTRPTIKDVAAVAGVHYTTVSLALRGAPSIPAATRERIRAAADRLGYVRDPAFLALCGRRPAVRVGQPNQRIAVVFNRSPENGFAGFAHYRCVDRGARKQAAELGYDCEVLFADRSAHTSKSLHRHLQGAGIYGVVLAAFEPDRPSLDLPWSEYCAVKFDSRQVLPPFTFISVDQFHYTRLAFQRMRALGYRRIGLAVGANDAGATDGLHVSAFLLEQAGLPGSERVPPFYLEQSWSAEEATRRIGPWLQRERVEAVISNWGQVRKLVRPYRTEAGRPVASAAMCMLRRDPGVAGIVCDMALVGARAVELLAGLLQAGRYGIPAAATSTYIRGTWNDGPTAPRCDNGKP